MNALYNYIHFIQDASEETFYLFPVIFITLSIITLLTQFYFTVLGRRKIPITDLYHFTSDESWKKIRAKKIINAGKNGRIFTTFNPKVRRIGSGKSKSKTPPTVIIRNDALNLFTSNQGVYPTGNKFNGSIFHEYSSTKRGNIAITNSKEYFNVIIISEAQFVEENGKRKFYLDRFSFLTIAHKWASQFIHLYAIVGLITIWYKIPLVERNWIFLPALALAVIYAGLKSGKLLKRALWEKE